MKTTKPATVEKQTPKRLRQGIRGLLVLESVLTLPVFLLSWLLSAIACAVMAGWKCANLPEPQRAAVLERLARSVFGVDK